MDNLENFHVIYVFRMQSYLVMCLIFQSLGVPQQTIMLVSKVSRAGLGMFRQLSTGIYDLVCVNYQ